MLQRKDREADKDRVIKQLGDQNSLFIAQRCALCAKMHIT